VSEVVSGQPLDVLAALCRRRGWALLLRTNGESTMMPVSTGADRATHLLSLDVVNPARRSYGSDNTRKRRLRAGDLLVRILVSNPADLQDAAASCLDQVGQRIQREAA
jgi:hypothetical protein